MPLSGTNAAFVNAFGLQGQAALITGGGSGLGLSIAECLVMAGAHVVLVGRREVELKAAVERIGKNATFIVHDVTRFDAAEELIATAERSSGLPISILINNAGIHLKKSAIQTSASEFQTVLNTHVLAAHALNRAVLPGMLSRKHGVILMTTSMAALMGVPLVIAYSAAKSAFIGMTMSLAAEVSAQGVRVNAIAPGWIESPMLQEALAGDLDRARKILSRTPIGKFGEASDIGWAAVYLCSPAARFVTGIVLPVDGGASIGF